MISVTVAGADDAVSLRDLEAISSEYPFVEWGILFSARRVGEPRYPSHDWTSELQNRFWSSSIRVALSAHLCGSLARAEIRRPFGGGGPLDYVGRAFRRVQINGHEPGRRHFIDPKIVSDYQWILQARSEETLQVVANDARDIPNASVLFDPSGGRGLEPFRWPRAPLGVKFGFAGGITPDNIEDVIDAILASNPTLGDFWIDMESGVRDERDRLALSRVGNVLATVARVNARMAESCR
jgi:hypothetical protein